jgi:glycosyltransferase involved in cell wall biosynthesis
MKKNNIKVLELGNPKGIYGAERWILALVNVLDREKITPMVATIKDELDQSAPLCLEAKKLGCLTHVFECYGKFNYDSVSFLKKYIIEKEIDILHTHGYKTDIIGLLAVRGTPCKLITTPHGWTNNPDFKLKCYEMLDRLVFRFFDSVVPLSDKLHDDLLRIPGLKKKLHLIYNGVDISEIKRTDYISEEMSSWKETGAFIIGYIGRLTEGKGLDVLFNAVKYYGRQDWKIAIVGDGEIRGKLENLVKSLDIDARVKFFGYIENRIPFLKGFDVFVLPSRSEGIPRCIMEAMVACVPVVATDISGCRDLVIHEKTGLLFAKDSPEELAQNIYRIIDDKELDKRICSEAFAFVDDRYSGTRMAHDYEVLFSMILENNNIYKAVK